MRTVTKYVCEDGREFERYDQAFKHDMLLYEINEALLPINPQPSLNSDEYVQHSQDYCDLARSAIVKLVRREFPEDSAKFLSQPDAEINPVANFMSRLLDGSGSPLYGAWTRLCCINWDNYREYRQPCFALHPEEAGKQVPHAPA